MICPSCQRPMVEVDNPMRREVRHRRGEEINCPAWRQAAGLPVDRFRCICDSDDLFEPPNPTPRVVPGCPAHRARAAYQRFALEQREQRR